MRRIVLAIAFATSACASEFAVPVTGQIGETIAQGEARARMDGNGTFSVATLDGLTCSGTYDSLNSAPTIQVPLSCSDGRTGRMLVTRAGMSGTVVGRLSDGTEGRFVFGDLVFSNVFPGGGAATR